MLRSQKYRFVLVSQTKNTGSLKRVGIPITYREERGGGVTCWWLREQQRQLSLVDGLISGARVLIAGTWRTRCCSEAADWLPLFDALRAQVESCSVLEVSMLCLNYCNNTPACFLFCGDRLLYI